MRVAGQGGPLRVTHLSPDTVGAEHAAAVTEARQVLAEYRRIDPELAFPAPDSLPARQRLLAMRAHRLHAFLTQPFVYAQPFTGRPGMRVPRVATVQGIRLIVRGAMDAVPA